jgi:4,5:9,10-diseco-3-hydroxy-5,9,17-trioxoandrosta-1(10),2-diene-4-oate hydrolase
MTALPEGEFVDVDGVRMHFHRVGEGAPVLWLHGSGPGASGWSNFRANAAALAEHGYCSILPDSVGYGLSDKPTDRGYTLDFMAGIAAGLMEALGHDTYAIVGNSQGGAQAIWIALHHADRVSKLVLMAPGGLEEREVYMEMRGIRSMLRCIYGPEGITLAGMQKVFEKQVHAPQNVPEGVIERRYDVAMTQPRHVFESMRVPNQSSELSNISCPTLGLWGMQDVFCPPSGATTLATSVPDCRVILLNRCGHWVMVEHEAVFNRAVLDFLQHG